MSSYENGRRIKTTLAGGIPDALGISDHSVPPTVSFANYCYALELVDWYGRV
jgi:hypothetical protein